MEHLGHDPTISEKTASILWLGCSFGRQSKKSDNNQSSICSLQAAVEPEPGLEQVSDCSRGKAKIWYQLNWSVF